MARRTKLRDYQFHLMETLLRNIMQENDITPDILFTAVHNIFAHGELLDELGYTFTKDQLKRMFEHFEGLIKIARNLDKGSESID